MIRVGLVTSYNDRCGISEYAKHLVEYTKDPDIQIEVLPLPIAQVASGLWDIVHLNCAGYTMSGFEPACIKRLQDQGKKVLLTWHDSNPVNNRNEFTNLFDRVVVHEPDTTDGFTFIPQGAPVANDDPPALFNPGYIGTSGFPLARKNLDRLAEACQAAQLSLYAYAPDSHHQSAEPVANEIRRRNPTAVVHTGWYPDQDIIYSLSQTAAVCYPYTSWQPGPSAAAMVGIAAQRPVILSRASQFHHLFKYEEQFYWIESENPSVLDIHDMLVWVTKDVKHGTPKIPSDVYKQFRWDKVAVKYAQLYKEMIT